MNWCAQKTASVAPLPSRQFSSSSSPTTFRWCPRPLAESFSRLTPPRLLSIPTVSSGYVCGLCSVSGTVPLGIVPQGSAGLAVNIFYASTCPRELCLHVKEDRSVGHRYRSRGWRLCGGSCRYRLKAQPPTSYSSGSCGPYVFSRCRHSL